MDLIGIASGVAISSPWPSSVAAKVGSINIDTASCTWIDLHASFGCIKYCHIYKLPSVIIDCTRATSSAAHHLGQPAKGHNLNRMGVRSTPPPKRASGQLSLREALAGSFVMPQATANAIGNFNIQRFRYAVVL
jgi:hypothetical protein